MNNPAVQNAARNRTITPDNDRDIREFANTKDVARGAADKSGLAEIVGVARPTAVNEIERLVAGGLEGRRYVLQRTFDLISSGDYKNFTQDGNKLSLFTVLSSGQQPTQQPAGQAAAFSGLRIYISTSVSRETKDELLNKLGVRITYNDGREPYEFPLREALMTATRGGGVVGVAIADPGGDDTEVFAVSDDTELLEVGRMKPLFGLAGEDQLVILPGDSQKNIEFFWLTDAAASPPEAPAGEEASIVLAIVAEGVRFSQVKRGRS